MIPSMPLMFECESERLDRGNSFGFANGCEEEGVQESGVVELDQMSKEVLCGRVGLEKCVLCRNIR